MVGELPQPPTRADLQVSLLASDWSLAGYLTSDWRIVTRDVTTPRVMRNVSLPAPPAEAPEKVRR